MGSNLGESQSFLRAAVGAIDDVVAVSPVYETEPVGGPEQGKFLNIVVEVNTVRTPEQLLALCQELEAAADRVREIRWGPRTLDVDVVWIDGYQSGDPVLSVPHPRAHERNFVMRPLLDLDPDLEMPGYEPANAIGRVRARGPL
ncbi:MAG: 2-amino-4-hydroxy-6-hydroxymethyldihydropteridine diphosphokinase [Acidimicrobiales bacterium]|nr:2-amino-4-hydroxy-6-hydroxymethyldihydropteridine diphosphokinase [Acidimicrobiales bacterium]